MAVPRKMPRFRRRFRVRYRSDGETDEHMALTTDVSPGGLGVVTHRPADPGEALHLVIELPDGEALEVLGRVVWSRRVPRSLQVVDKGGFGVEVTQADERWFRWFTALAA